MPSWYWIIFAFLFGWSWWWWLWFWRWPWWPWWPFPFPPPRPGPDPDPPIDFLRFRSVAILAQLAAGIGGAGALALLGPRLAPDGGLLAASLLAAVGATTLGSVATMFAGGAPRSRSVSNG